jgi:hypothetical protein
MDDQSKVTATFTCPTSGCGQPVTYRPRKVLGLAGYDPQVRGGTKVVYLTCPQGHTHRFEIAT